MQTLLKFSDLSNNNLGICYSTFQFLNMLLKLSFEIDGLTIATLDTTLKVLNETTLTISGGVLTADRDEEGLIHTFEILLSLLRF